jgi:hypothetical protein
LTTADNVAAARTELDLPAPTATTTSSPPVAAPAAAPPTVLALPGPGLAAAEHKSVTISSPPVAAPAAAPDRKSVL